MRSTTAKKLVIALAAWIALGASPSRSEAQPTMARIRVINNDGAGEGFNDATAFTPVGGNPAVTLGKARLIAFQHAAFLWSRVLQSAVEIQIRANFDPQFCTTNNAVLGSAGPFSVDRDFPNRPVPNTYYPQALANARAGFDRVPADPDIEATFNGDLDSNPACLTGLDWYYGLDGANPPNTIDFVTVVFHEIAHGLGFSTFHNLTTGEKFLGRNDHYLLNLDRWTGSAQREYQDMTDAERAAANIDDPDVTWDGPRVTAARGGLTAGVANNQVRAHAPNPVQGGSSISHFSTALFPDELMEPSYTGPNHRPGLALSLMEDIGWTLLPTDGTDVVFILDHTGSTGQLISGWISQIPTIARSWAALDPNVRFAVVTHDDFPFAPYGLPNDKPFQVWSRFPTLDEITPGDVEGQIATLQAALAAIPPPAPGAGGDAPENQYEALWQVLNNIPGRQLVAPITQVTPEQGEFAGDSTWGRVYPYVIYHFTHPSECPAGTPCFHDRDRESTYPVATPIASFQGRQAVLDKMAEQFESMQFFGLTFVSGASSFASSTVGSASAQESLFYRPAPQSSMFVQPLASAALAATGNPLAELARASGGLVLPVGTVSGGGADLAQLQQAIATSISHYRQSDQFDPGVDQDGVADAADNCPSAYNPNQENLDADARGDACDNCVAIASADQGDNDRDSIGNPCDNCRDRINQNQRNDDGDALGNACDPDVCNPPTCTQPTICAFGKFGYRPAPPLLNALCPNQTRPVLGQCLVPLDANGNANCRLTLNICPVFTPPGLDCRPAFNRELRSAAGTFCRASSTGMQLYDVPECASTNGLPL